jgi:hypothetical protein
MAQLNGLSKPVTVDDPSIAPEMQAQERLAERTRQDRRAAASGTGRSGWPAERRAGQRIV